MISRVGFASNITSVVLHTLVQAATDVNKHVCDGTWGLCSMRQLREFDENNKQLRNKRGGGTKSKVIAQDDCCM